MNYMEVRLTRIERNYYERFSNKEANNVLCSLLDEVSSTCISLPCVPCQHQPSIGVLIGRVVQCVSTYYTTSIDIVIEVIKLFKLRVILDVQLVIVYQFLCILSLMLCEIICINVSFTTLANKCT